MSPENRWLEDVFPTEMVTFLGDMLVFRGVMLLSIFVSCNRQKLRRVEAEIVWFAGMMGFPRLRGLVIPPIYHMFKQVMYH